MKKWLALFLLAAVAVSADTLTQADRDKAVAELEGSRKVFLDATKGLSPAQWNFKPAPERWSVAECAEHIALSEGFIFGLVSNQVVKGPATPEKREAVKGKDELIVKMLQDRSHKATAPEPIDPTKRPMSAEDSMKLFLDSRAKTIDYVTTTPSRRLARSTPINGSCSFPVIPGGTLCKSWKSRPTRTSRRTERPSAILRLIVIWAREARKEA